MLCVLGTKSLCRCARCANHEGCRDILKTLQGVNALIDCFFEGVAGFAWFFLNITRAREKIVVMNRENIYAYSLQINPAIPARPLKTLAMTGRKYCRDILKTLQEPCKASKNPARPVTHTHP